MNGCWAVCAVLAFVTGVVAVPEVGRSYPEIIEVEDWNIESLKLEHRALLVEFYSITRPTGVLNTTISRALESDGWDEVSQFTFGRCNVDANHDLKMKLSLKGLPVFKLFKNGKVYHAHGDDETLLGFIRSHLHDSPVMINSPQELTQFLRNHPTSVVAHGLGNADEQIGTVFRKVADELRAHYAFAEATYDSVEPVPMLSIRHHDVDHGIDEIDVFEGQTITEGTVHSWISANALPMFSPVADVKSLATLAHGANDVPIAFLVGDPADPAMAEATKKLKRHAPKLRGVAFLASLDKLALDQQATVLTQGKTPEGVWLAVRHLRTGGAFAEQLTTAVTGEAMAAKIREAAAAVVKE